MRWAWGERIACCKPPRLTKPPRRMARARTRAFVIVRWATSSVRVEAGGQPERGDRAGHRPERRRRVELAGVHVPVREDDAEPRRVPGPRGRDRQGSRAQAVPDRLGELSARCPRLFRRRHCGCGGWCGLVVEGVGVCAWRRFTIQSLGAGAAKDAATLPTHAPVHTRVPLGNGRGSWRCRQITGQTGNLGIKRQESREEIGTHVESERWSFCPHRCPCLPSWSSVAPLLLSRRPPGDAVNTVAADTIVPQR